MGNFLHDNDIYSTTSEKDRYSEYSTERSAPGLPYNRPFSRYELPSTSSSPAAIFVTTPPLIEQTTSLSYTHNNTNNSDTVVVNLNLNLKIKPDETTQRTTESSTIVITPEIKQETTKENVENTTKISSNTKTNTTDHPSKMRKNKVIIKVIRILLIYYLRVQTILWVEIPKSAYKSKIIFKIY